MLLLYPRYWGALGESDIKWLKPPLPTTSKIKHPSASLVYPFPTFSYQKACLDHSKTAAKGRGKNCNSFYPLQLPDMAWKLSQEVVLIIIFHQP